MNTFLAVLGMGNGEFMVCAAILVLLGAKKIPMFFQGLGQGIREFKMASRKAAQDFDDAGFDAGRNLGGIHGKPAFEALTIDNQKVELYQPTVFQDATQTRIKPGQKMNKFFQSNIGRAGRLFRGLLAVGFFVGTWFVFPLAHWAGIVMFCLGAFTLFEALRGWCSLRACGIKTKL
jgi:sec-independent protein translocase protein TatA